MTKKNIVALCLAFACFSFADKGTYQIAVVKYRGGGDWYSNPTSVPNLVDFCNKNLKMNMAEDVPFVEIGSVDIFNYPFVHLTGHGNVIFSPDEFDNLRTYLKGGGFLHVDDNYGMDQFIRPQLQKIFPDEELVELPFSHPIYHQSYDFDKGLPKVHEHDGKPPQGYGLFYEDRLVCFYTYECDLGDGWEDLSVHNDSKETRTKALQMGANILEYALTNKN
ncbi:MAG: DUF4159 domain-containing protein [Flavobacteriales bacterium]|nr:DUF4159 domain-containing protein [Flavobacteriales bacterium]